MNKLLVVWKTSNDTDIHNFVLPYAYNAKKHGWFDQVDVLIWGASQEKVKEDSGLHQKVKKLIQEEINVYACKMCADNVDSTNVLEELGVNVMYTGKYLSTCLQDSDYEVITL